jgi:hypothetical protein
MHITMTTKSLLKQLRTIFIAITAGLGLFFVAAWLLGMAKGPMMPLPPVQLQYLKTILILLAFAGIPAAHYFHKTRAAHINPHLSNTEKLLRFRVSYFIKLATFEGLGLIGLLAYLLSADRNFLLIFGLFMVVLVINYPTKAKVAEELQMDADELFANEDASTN